MSLHYTLLLLIIQVAAVSTPSKATTALSGCRDRCGDVTVSYPFGIGEGCYFDERFNISCLENPASPPKAYLGTRQLNVTRISLPDSELQVLQYVTRDCYDESGHRTSKSRGTGIYTLPRSFTISVSKNKFTAIGCDTNARIRGYTAEGRRYSSGCMSVCDRLEDVDFGTCSGIGCCQIAAIPDHLVNITVWLDSSSNHSQVLDFDPCSYAVLAEASEFGFSNKSFRDFEDMDDFPMVLDWRIENVGCDQARTLESFACKRNSGCAESKTGSGYVCRCLPGFDGNPYHPDGCQDIDECLDPNRCTNGICTNTIGGFNCTCLQGYTKTTNGTVCSTQKDSTHKPTRALLLYVPLGISIGVIALVFVSLMLLWGHNKRKWIRQKEKFFQQNGGLILQNRLLNDQQGSFEAAKIFTEEELTRATNNYRQIVGEGGYGTVYKGVLPDNRLVAIKKPKINSHAQTEQQTEQFINEVILLLQINHRNVVRLLGCCLDTQVPILVYEFISNGTLFERIHCKDSEDDMPLISWDLRLKIAAETAGALAYLHHEINSPIIHRDVKTMNILLDETYTAKVSDFGTSRIVHLDEEQLSTLVQGTIGYLDPEYLQSSKLTEKSDVYSFGVVLAELLTGVRPFSFDKSEGTTSNLAMSFLSIKEDQLGLVIDDAIDYEANMEAIKEVAKIAKRCLSVRGDERPTMKEVAIELWGIGAVSNHPWRELDMGLEEEEYLLGPLSMNNRGYGPERGQNSTGCE